MDLFITKIALRKDVQYQQILDLIKEWLSESPHYENFSFNYNGEEQFYYEKGTRKISILDIVKNDQEVFACHFENKEKDNILWVTDCIYEDKLGDKNICIKLSCDTNRYTLNLPKLHKPYIIKRLIEKGYCKQDGEFPITDRPIMLTKEDLEKSAKIMIGELKTDLPVVYLSYDGLAKKHYAVDSSLLAQKLSGIAHVLVEPDKDFAYELRELAKDKNAYNGYVGVYFPLTEYREILARDINNKTQRLIDEIQRTVQQASLNHSNIADLTWEGLQIIYHQKNWEKQKNITNEKSKELDNFIASFDKENRGLKEKVQELQVQLDKKNCLLEKYKASDMGSDVIKFRYRGEKEWFQDETKDLIINLLLQYKSKILDDSRLKEVLSQFLEDNQMTNIGKNVENEIKEALKEKSIERRRKKLKDCGFEIIQGAHDKLVYRKNSKYTFSLSNTPSDHREAENLYSDICKRISVYRKIF